MVSPSTLVGAAAEHYVMCLLLRSGLIAALAPVGVPNADIVVTDEIGDRLFAIQVKARREIGSDKGWHMGRKHESLRSDTLFYCFVSFGKEIENLSRCWIVPSSIVADTLTRMHQAWLHQPGKNGQSRNDTDFRRFLPDYSKVAVDGQYGAGWLDEYEGAWHLLKQQTQRVPT